MITRKKSILSLCTFLVYFAWGFHALLFSMNGTVSGKVIDKETKKGIPNVSVNIFHDQYGNSCETDKDGKFVFFDITPGEITLSFLPPPPYAMPFINEMKEYFKLENGKNLCILKKLEYGGTLIGKVYDKNTNTPLNILDVWIYQHPPTTLKIKDNGEFQIDQIKPGNHILKLCVQGFGPKEKNDIEIQSKEVKRIEFTFDSTASTKISGNISCINDSFLFSNKKVNLFLKMNDIYSYCYTNSNGYYTFNDVKPGEYDLIVTGVKEINNKPEQIKYIKSIRIFNTNMAIVNLEVDCSLNYSFFKGELNED